MLTLRLAFRNLLRQKRRTLFTGLSMLVGFTLSSFFIGWADGTYDEIIDGFTRNRMGQIQIHRRGYLERPSLYETIDDPGAIEAKLDSVAHLESWTPRVFAAGLVSVAEKSVGAQVIGIDPEREDRTTGFARRVAEGRYFSGHPHETLIGKELAQNLNVGLGGSVVIVSQAADGSIAADTYRLVGLVSSGDALLDRSGLYLSLADAQSLFALGERVHEIAITVDRLRWIDRVTAELRRLVSGTDLSVAPWQEFASEFYRAMQADKGGMYVSLLVVVIVVAITILNTVLMSVLERQKEYGVLRALGTRPDGIVGMVLAETSLLALACIALGSVMGFLLNLYFSRHGIALPNPIEWGSVRFDTMRGEVNARSFLLPAVTVMVTSLLVCLPPALRAARVEPSEAMRTF